MWNAVQACMHLGIVHQSSLIFAIFKYFVSVASPGFGARGATLQRRPTAENYCNAEHKIHSTNRPIATA